MTYTSGTYGQLNRDGSFRGVFTSPTDFEGRPGLFLPIVQGVVPSYNASTQKVVVGSYVVQSNQVLQTWSVVSLSQAELDAAADSAEDSVALGIYAKFVDGSVTLAQQTRVLKRILKWYLQQKGLL